MKCTPGSVGWWDKTIGERMSLLEPECLQWHISWDLNGERVCYEKKIWELNAPCIIGGLLETSWCKSSYRKISLDYLKAEIKLLWLEQSKYKVGGGSRKERKTSWQDGRLLLHILLLSLVQTKLTEPYVSNTSWWSLESLQI